MKNLIKSLLATLMLIGISLTANASCGFDGNNEGGLSAEACMKQELLREGKKVSEDVGIYSFIVKHGRKDGIEKLRKLPDVYSREISGITPEDIKMIKFEVYVMEMHLNQLAIEEIERRAKYFPFRDVILDEDLYFK